MSVDKELHIISFKLAIGNSASKRFICLLTGPKLINFILPDLLPDIITTPYGPCDSVIL
jgi:hypothetical protein